MRGFFAIGVFHPKNESNIGTLWRTAKAAMVGYRTGSAHGHAALAAALAVDARALSLPQASAREQGEHIQHQEES